MSEKLRVGDLFAHKQPVAQEAAKGMTLGQGLKAQLDKLIAEGMAEFRGGREDAWNGLIPAFPDSLHASREMGEPGSPTPQLVTEALTGRNVDGRTDVPVTVASLFGHRDRQQEQERTRGLDSPER